MREIRFRGRNVYTGEWVFGNYCKAELLNGEGFEHFIIEIGKNEKIRKLEPDTVGQYIGLRDMTGKPAYEGDITEDDRGRKWVIYWTPGGFGTCRAGEYSKIDSRLILANELGSLQNSSWFMKNHRIIGNIHDNPDLLKERQ